MAKLFFLVHVFGLLLFSSEAQTTISKLHNDVTPSNPPLLDGPLTQCVAYNLHNECEYVVGAAVSVPSSGQLRAFDEIALLISNARMVPIPCRRGLVWYYCNSVFPMCEENGGSVRICLPDLDSCNQVNKDCRKVYDGDILNCTARFDNGLLTKQYVAGDLTDEERNREQQCGTAITHSSATMLKEDTSDVANISNSPPPPCSSSPTLRLHKAQQSPIPVLTCLGLESGNEDAGSSGNYSIIECCLFPFKLDNVDNLVAGECAVRCPQYDFSETAERGIGIFSFVMVWADTLIFLVSVIPYFFMTNLRQFPGYVTPLTSFCVLMMLHTWTWSMYTGYCEGEHDYVEYRPGYSMGWSTGEHYLCGDVVDYLTARMTFGNSFKCKIQAAMMEFFLVALSYWQLILAICVLSYPYHNSMTFLKLFRPAASAQSFSSSSSFPLFSTAAASSSSSSSPPSITKSRPPLLSRDNEESSEYRQQKRLEKLIHCIGWGTALFLSVLLLILSYIYPTTAHSVIDGKSFLTYIPAQYGCFVDATGADGLGLLLMSPQAFFALAATVLFIIALVGIIRINWRLLLMQWRSMFYLGYTALLTLQMEFVLMFALTWNSFSHIAEFAYCVASHPQMEDNSCVRSYFPYSFFLIFQITVFTWVGIATGVVYLTNPVILGWWKALLFNHEVVRHSCSLNLSWMPTEYFPTSSKSMRRAPVLSSNNVKEDMKINGVGEASVTSDAFETSSGFGSSFLQPPYPISDSTPLLQAKGPSRSEDAPVEERT